MGAPGARQLRQSGHADAADCWQMLHAAAAPKLSSCVAGYTAYQEHTSSFVARRELPSLRPVLIVNLGAPIRVTGADGVQTCIGTGCGFLGGLHDRPAVSESSGEQAGIHVWLTMEGFQRLMGTGAGDLANRAVALDDVLGRQARTLGHMLADASDQEKQFASLDAALAGWIDAGHAVRSEIAWAFAELARHPHRRIGDLAQAVGWSRKTLARQFQARVGLQPKTVSRLARFQRLIAACGPATPDWSQSALDAGYFDQSHMIRDFNDFAGLTPSAYYARLLPGGGGVAERQVTNVQSRSHARG